MEHPTIAILIITYDRPREIRQTINALKQHVKYDGPIHWHLADDGSPGLYVEDIKRDYADLHFTATITDRQGFGANVNKALTYCHAKTDYVFLIEDDRPPIKTFDFDRAVALLMSNDDAGKPEAATERKPIGAIRLGGIAGHWLWLELREANTPIGVLNYLHILHNSPFLNVYSNQPYMTHRRFWSVYGMLPEGKGLADTETTFAHRVKDKADGPWICCLHDGIEVAQNHIGHSRQATDLDIGYKP